MERMNRTAFQGITNIVRFNWHYYIISIAAVAALATINYFPAISRSLGPAAKLIIFALILAIILTTIISLAISWFIYDHSDFYSFNWLDDHSPDPDASSTANIDPNNDTDPPSHILNVNAGFDETSWIIKNKFPHATLTVADFYDPDRHTQISIERARKAYPKYPGTIQIRSSDITIPAASADCIFLIFSAHEIRDRQERIEFFRQLGKILTAGGQMIVVEHLRDWRNFLAYNIGFFHFYPLTLWKQTYTAAGFAISDERKPNPFISIFFLNKDGTTP